MTTKPPVRRFSAATLTKTDAQPALKTSTMTTTTGTPQNTTNNWFFQGNAVVEEEARDKARRDINSKSKRQPLRFRMNKDEQPRQVIILDAGGDSSFGLYEWDIWDNNAKQEQTLVASPHNYDPIERWANTKKPEYVTASKSFKLFLTVLDMNPYVNKDGVEVPYSKKLLALKGDARQAMLHILAQVKNARGLALDMVRTGDKSPRTGVPNFIVESTAEGPAILQLTEEQLITNFGHEERKRQDGTVYHERNHDIMPFNYPEVFEAPNLKEQAELFGIPYQPLSGSIDHVESVLGKLDETPQAQESEVYANTATARLNLRNLKKPADTDKVTTDHTSTLIKKETTVKETTAATLAEVVSAELTDDEVSLPWEDET